MGASTTNSVDMEHAISCAQSVLLWFQLHTLTSNGLEQAVSACESVVPGLAEAILAGRGAAPCKPASPLPGAPAPAAAAPTRSPMSAFLPPLDVGVRSRSSTEALFRTPGSSDGGREHRGFREEGAPSTPLGLRKRPRKDHRVCCNCGSTKTPFWRKHRASGKPLCNACGLYSAKNDDAPRPAKLWREEQAAQRAASRGAGRDDAGLERMRSYGSSSLAEERPFKPLEAQSPGGRGLDALPEEGTDRSGSWSATSTSTTPVQVQQH
ncbi:hypothetical protein QBZ16_003387 [Prototheca wickerhamii]|uniref:GATA-type domain-containing protein n=1 Tax=Prototheca wickerhamii TaxID=3111 RepID=A0AAD9ILR4_PROWI|nr:hypothetical protein QBZ16_003387 [Prototheca wickerhamii]